MRVHQQSMISIHIIESDHLVQVANYWKVHSGGCSIHRDKGLAKLLMDNKAKYYHHSSAAIVELNATLLELHLVTEDTPAKVKITVPEVTRELSRFSAVGRFLHKKELKKSEEAKDLANTKYGVASVTITAAMSMGEESKECPEEPMSPGRWVPPRVTIWPRKSI